MQIFFVKIALPRARAAGRAARPMVAPFLIAVVALAAAIGLWFDYSPAWRQLWTDVVHDRNAHLEAGLSLASDVTSFRVCEVVRDIDRARTWPPLHDLALVGIVAGFGPKYAVLPGLLSYIVLAVLAFLLTRRLAGPVGGAVAACLCLASPAVRAFATDVMLEGPGAAATLGVLYAAVRARDDDTPGSWTGLAIALSAAFFIKYNYWLLLVIPLAPIMLPGALCRLDRGEAGWAQFVRGWWRQPFAIVTLALFALAAGLRGTSVSPTLALTAAWWSLCLQTLVWLRTTPGRLLASDPRLGPIVKWHVTPMALWLAWPGKLSSFLWFLWPGSNSGEFPTTDRLGGFTYYARVVATDYHSSVVTACVVAGLALLAVFAPNRRAGILGVAAFLLVAILLTAPHPNRKSRFVHSWLPAAWVLAGCGVGVLARSQWKPWGVGFASLIVATQLPALTARASAPDAGVRRDRPSALELTDSYLPHLADARKVAVLSNVPLKFLARWTYQDLYDRPGRMLTEVPGFDATRIADGNHHAMSAWLTTTPIDTIVLIELPATSPWYVPVPGCAGLEQIGPILRSVSGWKMTFREELSNRGGATVSVWKREQR
ncbi:MAG: glycosyltransferase family 39 protein [Gemmataceae bacterium]|nr:glycosyltransferase family 39 protein [Gemmataceae bacterium]